MAGAKKLQERVPLRRTAWMLADLVLLFLLLAQLGSRTTSLLYGEHGGAAWLAALVCEAWFTFVWILNMNGKWSPVLFKTYPENLSERIDELPAVDMFVTTADPRLEPPVITVNTVLSLLAVDYPAVDKLACYVSDDGCSPLTFYALRESAMFAKLWVPFCKRHDVGVRAPFVYFSSRPEFGPNDHKFLDDWTFMKSEYEKLVSRIKNAEEGSLLRHGGDEFAEFLDTERRKHPTIIKVMWDNSKSRIGEGFPSLIYISREKSPKHQHHFKAGAMNVLTRVSAVMTNAPIMLNVDCDMFANNPQVIHHAMCLLVGFDDEINSGFVQAPQQFYDGLKDDPFGNQLEVFFKDFKDISMPGRDAFTAGKSFMACHQTLLSDMRGQEMQALGEKIEEKNVVKRLLRAVSDKFIHIATTIEYFGDVNKATFEEVVGYLKAYEERRNRRHHNNEGEEHLLLTKAQWEARSSGREGGGRGSKPKRNKSHIKCFNCDEYGHYASECRKPKRDRVEQVNLMSAQEDEPTLL